MKNFDVTRMKQLFSVLTIVFLALYAYGVNYGLPLLLLCFGVRQIFASKWYFSIQQKNFGFLSLCMGIFMMLCSIVLLVGMITGA